MRTDVIKGEYLTRKTLPLTRNCLFVVSSSYLYVDDNEIIRYNSFPRHSTFAEQIENNLRDHNHWIRETEHSPGQGASTLKMIARNVSPKEADQIMKAHYKKYGHILSLS